MKKALSILLAVMILTTSINAFAAEVTAPGTGTSAVPLTAAATTFSVTVPMSLPVEVDGSGQVVSANTAKIVNNSFGSVVVTDVAITGTNGWEIASFSTDMTQEAVDSKQIGFMLNGDETVGTALSFSPASYPVMDGANASDSDEISLTYDAVIPAQSMAITAETVANVVFTLAWNK